MVMIGPSPGYQRFYYVHPVVFLLIVEGVRAVFRLLCAVAWGYGGPRPICAGHGLGVWLITTLLTSGKALGC
jgi:hypothetical protein